jgi:hypothetical protein
MDSNNFAINESLGLELSPSRDSSYQDLADAVSTPRRLPRPPSYSDSFLVLAPPGRWASQPLPAASLPPPATGGHDSVTKPSVVLTKIMSVGTHITLIGIFETVFYFEFISKSEDGGIQATINQFLQGTLQQCASWPANTTAVLAELLALTVNQSAVSGAASQAAAARNRANSQLENQAWLYVVVLASCLLAGSLAARIRGHRIHWREVVVDNIFLVTLLGAYEAFFFKTIIYNYQSLSLPELEQSILQQLGSKCGI